MQSWENIYLHSAFNQASAAPLTWPRLPCSSLYPQVPGSVPASHGWSEWDKEKVLHLAASERQRDSAAGRRGEAWAQRASLSWAVDVRGSSPTTPAPAAPPSPPPARSRGHRREDCSTRDTTAAGRSENNGRAGSKEALLPAFPGSRKSLPRRWARAPPHPGMKAAPRSHDKSLPSRPTSAAGVGAGPLRLQDIQLSDHSRFGHPDAPQ